MHSSSILVVEPQDYDLEALRVYQSLGRVQLRKGSFPPPREEADQVEVLVIRLRYHYDRKILDAFPSLRWIVSPTTGLDHIDLGLLSERGIGLVSLRGEHDFLRSIPATAELTWGLLLAVQRKLVPAALSVRDGQWDRSLFVGRDLREKSIGILGVGRVGEMVADFARAFGMRVLGHDLRERKSEGIRYVDRETLYHESEILSVHLPLDPQTINLVGCEALDSLPRGAIVLNTARGGIVDEEALADRLEAGVLGGAGLDVLAREHSTERSAHSSAERLIGLARRGLPVLLTPHLGGASLDSMRATERFCARRLEQVLQRGDEAE